MNTKTHDPSPKTSSPSFRYPGGKNADGTYQRIINQIPPHVLYVEPFAGSAAICRNKRPAERSVLIDLDPGALAVLAEVVPRGTVLLKTGGIAWLEEVGPELPADAFVYCDPPYLPSTRSKRRIYRWELTEAVHRAPSGGPPAAPLSGDAQRLSVRNVREGVEGLARGHIRGHDSRRRETDREALDELPVAVRAP